MTGVERKGGAYPSTACCSFLLSQTQAKSSLGIVRVSDSCGPQTRVLQQTDFLLLLQTALQYKLTSAFPCPEKAQKLLDKTSKGF